MRRVKKEEQLPSITGNGVEDLVNKAVVLAVLLKKLPVYRSTIKGCPHDLYNI